MPVVGADGEVERLPNGQEVLVPFTPPDDDLPMRELAAAESKADYEKIRRRHAEAFERAGKRQDPAFEREYLIAVGKSICY